MLSRIYVLGVVLTALIWTVKCDSSNDQDQEFPDEARKANESSTWTPRGQPAKPNFHPYVVYIKATDGSKSTGVILDRYTILVGGRQSAYSENDTLVIGGMHSTVAFESSQQVRRICKHSTHSQYDRNQETYSYGFIYLSQPFVFNNFVQAIPLAPEGFVPKELCTFAAFGADSRGGGNPPKVLHDVLITLKKSHPECESFHTTKLCGTPSFCTNDPGGPLVCADGQRVVLYGIAGINRCKKMLILGNVANMPQDFFRSVLTFREEC